MIQATTDPSPTMQNDAGNTREATEKNEINQKSSPLLSPQRGQLSSLVPTEGYVSQKFE